MAIENVSQGSVGGLPQALRTVQEAILLPEVQEMLRRLSEYKLGIFMPHMHDEQTGEFRPLHDDLVQVESGLEVSFQPLGDIAVHADRFLPVGWLWRAGVAAPVAVCEMVSGEGASDDAEPPTKHKMKQKLCSPASFRRQEEEAAMNCDNSSSQGDWRSRAILEDEAD